jgi:hypothetical protein
VDLWAFTDFISDGLSLVVQSLALSTQINRSNRFIFGLSFVLLVLSRLQPSRGSFGRGELSSCRCFAPAEPSCARQVADFTSTSRTTDTSVSEISST